MSDIKSAFEIAMEKVEKLGEATEEERLEWKYVPQGEELAARYLKEKLNLLAELNNYEENTRKHIIKGAAEILTRNIDLPKNDFAKNTNRKAMEGLKFLKSDKAGVENVLVDTAVLDLPSVSINAETVRLIKSELGLPTGYAPANAIYGWQFVKKFGDAARCGAIASLMTNCADAGSDFILFGPVKFAKCVVPSIAMITGMNSYYRKRILRKDISEKNPLKQIF